MVNLKVVTDADHAYSDHIRKQLKEDGVVWYRPLNTVSRPMDFIKLFGVATSDYEGKYVSEIVPRDSSHSAGLGYTNLGLFPHTDRSGVQQPPNYLLLHCVEPSTVGGLSIIADGLELYDIVKKMHPEVFSILSKSAAARFFRKDVSIETAIFSEKEGRFCQIRYRNDENIVISKGNEAAFGFFNDLIEKLSLKIFLEKSDLLLLDNYRFLHGRTKFTGDRKLERIFFEMDDYLL